MHQIKELFEIVENLAASRPVYSLPNFLPRPVLEMGVLGLLEEQNLSGDYIIRELAPLSRWANGYGVSYSLLHEMEAAGDLTVYQDRPSRKRVYSLTRPGLERLSVLRSKYSAKNLSEFQIGFNVLNGFKGTYSEAYSAAG